MFVTRPKRFTLTLVTYIALVLTLATTSYAAVNVNRRDHGELKRLIKKRSPFPQGPVIGAAAPPAVPPSASPAAASLTKTPSPSQDAKDSSVPTVSTPVSASSSDLSVASISSSSSTSASSSKSSAIATSTSTSLPTTSLTTPVAPQSSQALDLTSSPVTATNGGKATVTRTAESTAASASSSAAAASASTKTKSTTLTVLIIIASSVGGVAILWTIFRKWKLGRSAKFDARLQPIDWQPTNSEDGIVPDHRRANSDTSSFHTGTGHGATSDLDHGNSDYGHGNSTLAPLPDHDFTAGPSTLTPVGGYADLSRGPSPQPPMQEALTRGPSLTRPNYDLGVPLHHQTGYAQGAYDYNGGAARY